MNIYLLPLSQSVRLDQLPDMAGGASVTIVADAYVEGAEHWQTRRWGWETQRDDRLFVNIDHHAPTASMQRAVSSGNLALVYVESNGPLPAGQGQIVINHCDCDSIITAAILSGIVAPDPRLGRAVIAADHTGKTDEIADALQPLESLRDLELSLASLQACLQGRPLPEKTRQLMEQRLSERAHWRDALSTPNAIRWTDAVAWTTRSDRIPAELLVSLLPAATAIMTARPGVNKHWVIKLRLGRAAPEGLSLFDLGITDFDPAFGGRWNAGSNNRGGGSRIEPENYARRLADALRQWPSNCRAVGGR